MNSERIGQAAGAVWKKLHDKGLSGIALADLKKITGFTADEVFGHDEWITSDGDLRTLPCHLPDPEPKMTGLDGFYAARLVRL
jgi:hypothetical protein